MAEEIKKISQIKTDENNTYDLDAKYIYGTDASAVITGINSSIEALQSQVHGAIDTYVISVKKKGTRGYEEVVYSTAQSVSTTLVQLKQLLGLKETSSFKIGDIILMEETSFSNGKECYDRWVSRIFDQSIYLSILETQVGTHHHTIDLDYGDALTGVNQTTPTSSSMAKVGSEVTVVTGVSTSVLSTGYDVITSISYDNNGEYSLISPTQSEVSTDDSYKDAVGHSHTVLSHTHSVDISDLHNTFVSQTISAYTYLSTTTFTPHSHTPANVASPAVDVGDSDQIIYVYDGGDTDIFIKTISYDSENTSSESLTTDSGGGSTTSSITVSTSFGGDEEVYTENVGSHSHSVTVSTTENVVTSVTLQPSVITSIDYTDGSKPSVQSNVVTSIVPTAVSVVTDATLTGETTFINSWSCTVDSSGILSFNPNTATVGINPTTSLVSTISTITTGTQSEGSLPVLSYTSATQTYTSSVVTATGSAENAGGHNHAFSHTHSLPSHTHGIASHNHSYQKTVVSTSGNAYVSLSTSTYIPHTHNSTVSVASASTDMSSIDIVIGGSTTDVVQNLKSYVSFNTDNAESSTDTQYYDISITYPGLTISGKKFTTQSVTPAEDSGESPIKSITFTSGTFVNSISENTSTNLPGESNNSEQ